MSVTRTNEEWLAALSAPGPERRKALEDLRKLIVDGLPFALSRWLSPDDPQFTPLIEEVAQETLLRVLDRLDSFQGRSLFSTWVRKIAVRVALTELRRKRWEDISLDDLTDPDTPGFLSSALWGGDPGPEREAEQHDLLVRIEVIIQEELTERQRRALISVGIHGVPTEEVARRMGMNRNALYKLLHDARTRLKRRMALEGLTPGEVLATFER